MVCGRWLTDVAPQSLFNLAHPAVDVVAMLRTHPAVCERAAVLDRADARGLT